MTSKGLPLPIVGLSLICCCTTAPPGLILNKQRTGRVRDRVGVRSRGKVVGVSSVRVRVRFRRVRVVRVRVRFRFRFRVRVRIRG